MRTIDVVMKTNDDVTVQSMETMFTKAKEFDNDDVESTEEKTVVPEPKSAVGKLIDFFGLRIDDITQAKAVADALVQARRELERQRDELSARLTKWEGGEGKHPPPIAGQDGATVADVEFYNYYNDQRFLIITRLSLLPTTTPKQEDVDDKYHNDLNERFKLFAGTEFWEGTLKFVRLLRWGVNSDDLRFEFLG
jgi:hypothetical protein